MRPLIRPTLAPADTLSASSADMLIHAFGAYCAFSEEPLFDVVRVWNRTSRTGADPVAAPDGIWDDALLVSPTTLRTAQRSDVPATKPMLTPDTDRTFSLRDSPFIYALTPVRVILTDENGKAQDKGDVLNLAIVTATTAAAQSTIDTFALNGRYFSPGDATMRMPASYFLTREDNRPFLRTEAWMEAETIADQIANTSPAIRPMLLQQVRMLAAARGFWSIWATVLWSRFGDRTMLARVLGRPDATRAPGGQPVAGMTLANVPGGVHQAFPGTRSGWLD